MLPASSPSAPLQPSRCRSSRASVPRTPLLSYWGRLCRGGKLRHRRPAHRISRNNSARRRSPRSRIHPHLKRQHGPFRGRPPDSIQYSILLGLDCFKCSRDEFVQALRDQGVEAAVHYPRAVHQQPVFTSENLRLPNCEWLTERILSLPVHPALSEAELERVADTVLKVTRLMYR